MNNTFRLILVAASLLALSEPVLAQTPLKADRAHQRYSYAEQQGRVTAPVAMHYDIPYQGFGSIARFSVDSASSPYAGGGY